jgi:predicted phosphodiesterase
MRLLPLLALFLLLAACELKETPDTASQPAEDVAAAADVAAEPTADTAAEAPDVGPELPVYPAVTFNKRPWLQWPTAESVTLLAETAEETPLDVVMTHAGGSFHLYTEPTRPTFQFLGMELEGLDGWFHQVDIPVPEGVGAFTVSVANADYIREVTLPQSLDSFTMIAFGDTRTHHDIHQQVADQVAAEKALVVFQTGDLMDSALELAQWNQFFQIEAKALQESFYFPIFGNHEIGGEDYYYTLFETRNSFGSERNWWLDLGQVGIIGIEQYATDWNDPEALVWLEAVLSQLQDKRWLIFAHHEPMYTFSNHGPWYEGRDVIQPMLEQYGVDLVLSGHNHCYERFQVNGIPYVVTGGGGAPLYSTGTGPDEEMDLVQSWGVFNHYMRLEITPDKLTVTVIDTEDGSTFDLFEL